MVKKMVKDNNYIKMEIFMKENIYLDLEMEKEF